MDICQTTIRRIYYWVKEWPKLTSWHIELQTEFRINMLHTQGFSRVRQVGSSVKCCSAHFYFNVICCKVSNRIFFQIFKFIFFEQFESVLWTRCKIKSLIESTQQWSQKTFIDSILSWLKRCFTLNIALKRVLVVVII